MLKNILNELVKISHVLLLFFLIFGIFLPPKYLPYYLFIYPAIYVHWYFNDNQCMLTELESHFDQKYLNINNPEEVRHYKYKDIFESLKKMNIYFDSIDTCTSYLYNIIFVCWIVGLIRLLHYYKKNIYNALLLLKKPLIQRLVIDKYK